MTIEATPLSVTHSLPRLYWCGLRAPEYDVASVQFANALAEASYPYVDGTSHDPTGRQAMRLPAKLYFLNSLEPDSFPALWNTWRRKLFSGSAGKLKHPLLGEIDARVLEGTVALDATHTSGVIVDLTWVETLLDPESSLGYEVTTASVKALATQMQSAMASAEIPFPDGAAVTDLLDAVKMIESALYSLSLSVGGMISQVQGVIDEVIGICDGLERATGPAAAAWQRGLTWPVTTTGKQLWCGLEDLRATAQATSARQVSQATAVSDTTLTEIQASHPTSTLTEIMGLNASLLGRPIVPQGTVYSYYA